ncbi:MAG: TIGR02757 family protein [Alistipes sp.]|jgi:uncharacterized protein (TIGR02757 family)|nr:TIGR02757 family protein [Alistipes sp.]
MITDAPISDPASFERLNDLLHRLHDRYNTPEFIADDPISIPHRFFGTANFHTSNKTIKTSQSNTYLQIHPEHHPRQNDIEIAGFLSATIAWGNRKAIVKSASKMMDLLDNAPYDFVANSSQNELNRIHSYVHRTFNGADFRAFLLSLRHIYSKFGSMGAFFETEYARTVAENSEKSKNSSRILLNINDPERNVSNFARNISDPKPDQNGDLRVVMSRFRQEFFTPPHAQRCEKHLSSIDRGAACKRLCMFLRWMIRRDDRGVDFGLWRGIPPSALYLPLDLHSANTARSLGLLSRRVNDWRSVEEATANLRKFDASDPAKFDFALFGAGIAGEFRDAPVNR